jgi:hypothetical protein
MGKWMLLGAAAVCTAAVVGGARDAHAEELRTLTLEPTVDKPQGPNPLLVTTGAVVFGVPYAFSAYSAATSHLSADKWLYVPVAGPWGDLIARYTCETTGCKGNLGPDALPLVLAGLGQAAGVGILIKALIDPPGKSLRTADRRVHVAPASYIGGGGVQAYGAF